MNHSAAVSLGNQAFIVSRSVALLCHSLVCAIKFLQKAVSKLGELAYDQCFGFVPLLIFGGVKDVEHLDKLKTLEHIYLMYQLTGSVMDD